MTNFTEKVVSMIDSDQWEKVGAAEFMDSVAKSARPEMLATCASNEMQFFKLRGFDCGFALNPMEGTDEPKLDIVLVHNNTTIKGLGEALIRAAIRNGGTHLDCYDGFLCRLYKKCGFVEYERYTFDIQYAHDWNIETMGTPDVVCLSLHGYNPYEGGNDTGGFSEQTLDRM